MKVEWEGILSSGAMLTISLFNYCSSCAPQLKQGLRNNPEEKKAHDYQLRGKKDAQFRKIGIFMAIKSVKWDIIAEFSNNEKALIEQIFIRHLLKTCY